MPAKSRAPKKWEGSNENHPAFYRQRSKISLRRARAQVQWRSTAADNGRARSQQRGFSLRSGGFVSRTPPRAAPPVPRDAVRLLGNRSEQRRQAGFQNRRRHVRRRHLRRRSHLARARQRAACFHDRAAGGLDRRSKSSKRSSRSNRLEAIAK